MKLAALALLLCVCFGATAAQPAERCGALALADAARRPLKPLLEDLARERGFRLEYWSADNPEVAPAGTNELELMTALAAQANLMVRYAPAGAGCPAGWTIDTVWVLPIGPPQAAPPRRPPAAPAPPDAATLGYLRAHGFAPRASEAASATH